jgi:hypothetical protein
MYTKNSSLFSERYNARATIYSIYSYMNYLGQAMNY